MKSLLLAVLAAVGLSGCYAEVAPYSTGYYGQPTYVTGGPVYTSGYGGAMYRPAYRPAAVYVAPPVRAYRAGYRAAPVYGGRGYRRF